MHNRCPKCGENILYCDPVIEAYSIGILLERLDEEGRYRCSDCEHFNEGKCKFSNYYGRVNGTSFNGNELEATAYRHYHTNCVKEDTYTYRRQECLIYEDNLTFFFAQIPEIEGLDNL